MSTQRMLKDFKELQAKLDKDGKLVSRDQSIRDLLKTEIFLYETQLEIYETEKSDPNISAELLEGGKPLTEQELDNLKEAKEIDRSIGKRLGAIRKTKKNAKKNDD